MLTPLPTIPTDSFYKFKAVAGIWLVAGSIGGASVAIFKYQNEWYDAQMRVASLQTEASRLHQEIEKDRRLAIETEKLTRDSKRIGEDMSRALADIEAMPDLREIKGEKLDDVTRRIGAIKERLALRAEMDRQVDAKLQTLHDRSDERTAPSSSLELEMRKLRLMAERFRFLSKGMIVTMTILAPLLMWGLRLAQSGLHEWRDLQSEQDAFLRRQWSVSLPPESPPVTPTTSPSSSVPPT